MPSRIARNHQASLDHTGIPGGAPMAAALLVALLSQMTAPAFARPAVGEGGPGVALAVGFGEALGGIFTTRDQDTHGAEIMLGAVALGSALGAAGNWHRDGGWATCAERDTSVMTPTTASLH